MISIKNKKRKISEKAEMYRMLAEDLRMSLRKGKIKSTKHIQDTILMWESLRYGLLISLEILDRK